MLSKRWHQRRRREHPRPRRCCRSTAHSRFASCLPKAVFSRQGGSINLQITRICSRGYLSFRRGFAMFGLIHFRTTIVLATLALVPATPTNAQSLGACRIQVAANPPRRVLLCGDALTIEAEEETRFRVRGRLAAGQPEGVSVSHGAVLIDLKPERGVRFQVLTPHALAAVRGTMYA